MTRRQVKGAMRKLREANEEIEEEAGEINLVPYMDIVTNIIIFLLASVVNAIPVGNINVALPSINSGGGGGSDTPPPPEKPPLNLTVTVGATSFIVAASGGVLPPIPKLDGKYNYKELSKKLSEIKKAPGNAAETKATFSADAVTEYEVVVTTLDAIREDEKGEFLFPDVVFAAGLM